MYILAKSISANTKTFNFRFLLTKLWRKVSIYKSSKIILQKNRILKNITFSSEQLLPIENFLLNSNKNFSQSVALGLEAGLPQKGDGISLNNFKNHVWLIAIVI